MDNIHIETPTLFVRRVYVCFDFNYQSIALKSQPCSWCASIQKQQQKQQHDDSNFSSPFHSPSRTIIIITLAQITSDVNLFFLYSLVSAI